MKQTLRDHLFTVALTIASAAFSFIVVYGSMSLFNILKVKMLFCKDKGISFEKNYNFNN